MQASAGITLTILLEVAQYKEANKPGIWYAKNSRGIWAVNKKLIPKRRPNTDNAPATPAKAPAKGIQIAPNEKNAS